MQERAPGTRRAGHLQIGIVQHDQCVVAAEFQRDPLQGPACRGAHLAADRGRAGERDHRHVRVLGQSRAGLGVAWQHMQQALGQPGLLE
jgi:hypothetical protein